LIDLHLIDKIDAVTIKEQSEEYKRILRDHDNIRVVVLLHSIDGPNLANVESQQRLAELFNSPHIQLICSLDSMRTVMLWSPSTPFSMQLLFKSSNLSSSTSILINPTLSNFGIVH
jgi:UDP-N-acetylglucosamine 2-epimerase